MSRIGKQPVKIPEKVTVEVHGTTVKAKGPKGELEHTFHPQLKIELDKQVLRVQRPSDSKYFKAQHGLARALINNMVAGVSRGFEKDLEIVGVGYKAETKGKVLVLALGYSHPIYLRAPDTITINCEAPQKVKVAGCDRALVGQIAAKIRSFRPPEPYKGKGIKYAAEQLRRKAGKTAA